MSEQRMDVFLLAAPQPGVERSQLVSNLAAAFKKDVPAIEKMLRRARTLVKSDIELELAEKYKALIEKSGGQCELVNHGEEPAPAPNEPPKAQSLALEPIASTATDSDDDEGDVSDAACYCAKCGTLIRIGQTKCPKCFTPVTEFSQKSKITAGFLAFFLGGLGVHRLYLGQWWGLVYLFFFWTLIPIVVAIIEAIIFWSTAQKTWDQKYGQVPKSGGAMIVVMIVSLFLLIAVIGIMAAVALPAYQDYTIRSKIQSAAPLVLDTRKKVAAFIKKTKAYPNENILVGLPDDISSAVVESIRLRDGAKLEVTYRIPGLNGGNTIVWTPTEKNGDIVWSCREGTVPDRYRSTDCRTGNTSVPNSLQRISSAKDLSQKLYSNDKQVSLRVPASWKAKELVSGAILGALNPGEENYVVIVKDAKADFEDQTTLSDYVSVVQQQLAFNIQNGGLIEEGQTLKVANLPAEQFIYQGSVDGLKVVYIVTLVESDTHFYRILAWTLQSRLDKNKEILQAVSASASFK